MHMHNKKENFVAGDLFYWILDTEALTSKAFPQKYSTELPRRKKEFLGFIIQPT